MSLGRTLCSAAVAAVLILRLAACGGGDDTTTLPTASPSVLTSSPTPTPSPTAADPTVAAKAKIMADYKLSIATQSRGIVSNSPTFPYEQVLTGNALSALKSTMTGAHLAGTKYGGGVRFVKAEVIALNLEAKPATATVQSCVFDGLKATSKSGKVQSSSTEISRQDFAATAPRAASSRPTPPQSRDDIGHPSSTL